MRGRPAVDQVAGRSRGTAVREPCASSAADGIITRKTVASEARMSGDEAVRMAEFEALAEKAYDEMYETRYPTGLYSDMKDFFALAIGAAERAGLADDAARLGKRRDHCCEVYRKHFSGF
jgi:hypothetical protein